MSIEDVLLREEGYIRHAYKDSEGFWTIGIGTLIDERAGGGISMDAALYLLREEIARIVARFDVAIPWWASLDPVRREVLLSMAYQMGAAGLLKFKRTLAAVQEGDYETASSQMLRSKWARQTPERAQRHSEAMLMGTWT